MERTDIEKAFIKAGLGQHVREIDALVRSSIRLHTTPVDESSLKPGISKIGGHPDLPAGVGWPALKGQSQSFLAQIQLADVQNIEDNGPLPRLGMLWFFYDARQETFGEQPGDRQAWQILFSDNPSAALQRAATPTELPVASLFQACALTFRNELTLALQPDLELPNAHWSDEDQQAYEQVLEDLKEPQDSARPHHRLLGYPDTIQDDMRQQCQLVSNGITNSDDPRATAMQKDAMDWLLLLQIDTDAGAKMNWANNGMIYYWIKQTNVQARHFDQNWLVLQSE